MPITSSAKKALRQSKRRWGVNLKYKAKIKNLVKQLHILLQQNKQEELKKLIPSLYKALDKAAKIGVIKKNAAARKKSRLTKSIAKSSSARRSPEPQ